MSLPDLPGALRPAAQPEQAWWWEPLDASGAAVTLTGDLAEQRFPHQGDAESWLGETWRELAEAGTAAVVLHEHERAVYGPMPLSE